MVEETISRRSAEPRPDAAGEETVEAGEHRQREGGALAERGCIAKQMQLHHWRAWAPILARVGATALALLGLAGIGWAARGSNEIAALTTAPLSFGLAQIASSSVAATPLRPAAAVTAARPLPCSPAQDAAAPAPANSRPSAAGAPSPPLTSRGGASPGLGADGRVILNAASAAELQRLPGVGAKRAAAILALRQRLGRLRRPSDLLRVKGIGPRLLERMLPLIVLDANVERPP
jgi:competence protein ComEA